MNKESLAVPLAIVVAAGLIAGAIYLKGTGNPAVTENNGGTSEEKPDIRPVDGTDHVRGNPNAPILLVEYSDYDCPFCDVFHETMNQVMAEYGAGGQVAWVFRHFPIEQLHPNAPKLAEAAECVAELGGNDAFWTFSDELFNSKEPNDKIDTTKLGDFATTAGVDRAQFTNCLDSGKYGEKIAEAINEAIKAGGKGTPHTVVIVGDEIGVINGAQPYETVKEIIDNLIAQTEGAEPATN